MQKPDIRKGWNSSELERRHYFHFPALKPICLMLECSNRSDSQGIMLSHSTGLSCLAKFGFSYQFFSEGIDVAAETIVLTNGKQTIPCIPLRKYSKWASKLDFASWTGFGTLACSTRTWWNLPRVCAGIQRGFTRVSQLSWAGPTQRKFNASKIGNYTGSPKPTKLFFRNRKS